MKAFTVTDVATELGVDPRALRRFLRSDPSYRNAGMGGRYLFSETEMKSLKRAFLHGKPKPAAREVTDDPHLLDDDPGLPVEKLGRKGLTPSLRAQRQQARALRQQRLLSRIDAVLESRTDDEVPVD